MQGEEGSREVTCSFLVFPVPSLGCLWLSRVEGALHTGTHKHVHTHCYTQAPHAACELQD